MSKKILYSLGVGAMLIGMASCSNDNVDGPNVINPDKAVGYAKVSINFPKADGTRADDPTYENGSSEEQTISEIHLALYDAAGRFVGTGEKISSNPAQNGSVGGNVEKIYSDVFQIYLDEEADAPTQVVAFINTPIKSGNLSSLENGYAIPVSKEIVGTENKFPMTNSGYYAADDSDTEWKMAVPFTYDNDHIFDTAESANSDDNKNTLAATIYVERLAAKVTVSNGSQIDQDNLNYKVVDVAGADVTLKFNPTRWTVTGTAKEENVVKSKFNTANLFEGYNRASDFRSFWAEGATFNAEFDKYYDTANKKVAADSPLEYKKFGDIMADGSEWGDNNFDLSGLTAIGESEYAPEHTSKLTTPESALLANTFVIVTGNYEISGTHSTWFNPSEGNYEFYLLLTGMDGDQKVYTAYTKSQLIGLLLSYNGVDKVYTGNGREIQTNPVGAKAIDQIFAFAEYFDLGYDSTQGKYVLAANTNPTGKLYRGAGEEGEITITSDMDKTTNSRHYFFPNGAAYFNVALPHAVEGVGEDAKTFYGLVRNHSYKLTINKIENLGATFDQNGNGKDDPIVPGIDDLKEHYINAQIDILSWHVVENGVTL